MVTSLQEDDFPETLIALHAVKSANAIRDFRRRRPNGRLALVLTGTDLYPQPSTIALASMATADFLVVLHPGAIDDLPEAFRPKTRVIVQSATAKVKRQDRTGDPDFRVCVVGHLREVKDPLLAARAARRLGLESRLRVVQIGGVLEPGFETAARHEMAGNPRYSWLGESGAMRVSDLLASSDLMVLSSRLEGGARVLGEALVHGTPVLSSRISAAEALLGSDYPGLFPVGDAAQLAALLQRAETNPGFLATLEEICAAKAGQFDPAIERAGVRQLAEDLLTLDRSQ